MASSPRTVEEIFKDFSARRTAVVHALTQGEDRLSQSSLCVMLSHLSFLVIFITRSFMSLNNVGLSSDDDAMIYLRNSILENLMSFYVSPLLDVELKDLIIETSIDL
ncbi:hypothetical protein RJT34_31146 [Clitoria ternatea]|uniref:URB1 C-terminal domain-containing protein n=1 Tax=Clitoria ternatea TaxID=43366 RepID=A0AAN9EUZ2_CLITE